MRKTLTTTINDIQFTYYQIDTRTGVSLGLRLAKIITPALGALVAGNEDLLKDLDIDNFDLDLDMLPDLLGAAMGGIEEPFLLELIDKLANQCSYSRDSGKTAPMMKIKGWEQCFENDYVLLLKWLAWVIKVEFIPFFQKRVDE